MRINATIELNYAEAFHENTVVTTDESGLPLSYIYDDCWEYSSMQKVAVGKDTHISFKKVPVEYRKDIQRSLHHVIEYITTRDRIRPTISNIEKWKKGLSLASRALRHCNWNELLEKKTFKVFQSNIRKLSIKSNTIGTLRIAINKLYECDLCSRSFTVKDFSHLDRCKKTEQHIAIPMNIYQKVLKNAIEDVEAYHPFRNEINRVNKQRDIIKYEEEARTDVSQDPKALKQRVLKRYKKTNNNLPDFEEMMFGGGHLKVLLSCMVVSLAFSGVRVGEVISFNKGSYEEISTDKVIISLLKGKTSKGNDGLPKTESWQTHWIVKDALELAYDMNEHLRETYKLTLTEKFTSGVLSKSLFEKAMREVEGAFIPILASNVVSTYVLTNISSKMKFYMNNMGICATKDDVIEFDKLNPSREGQLEVGGTLPKLSPHDFRRTFAVFFKRYGFGSDSTIKFQYKHQNIYMSEYYANNAALQAMDDILMDSQLLDLMKEEGINLGIDIYEEIYQESAHLSGVGGEMISQDKFNAIKDGHKVYMSRSEIEILVRSGTLSAVKLPSGGYCLNPTCSRVCGIEQFAAEIKPCDHQVITDNQAKVVLRQNKRLIETFRGMNTGDSLNQSILLGMKQKIKLNEVALIKHELKFDAFDDEVVGLINTKEDKHAT